MSETRIVQQITLAALVTVCFWSTAVAVEPEKQPIYSNTIGGLCGVNIANQCTVPAGERLVIEYVSGYAFEASSTVATVPVSLVITDSQLGLNGNSFHSFIARKSNSTGGTDVFIFSAPLKMMLHPGAKFYFSGVVSVAVSGYLVGVRR